MLKNVLKNKGFCVKNAKNASKKEYGKMRFLWSILSHKKIMIL